VSEAPGTVTPISDLFATAVHRFGVVWADLLVASLVMVGVASVPVAVAHSAGRGPATIITAALAYGIGYQAFLAFVILRGLPAGAPGGRVAAAYSTAVVVGALTGVLAIVLEPFVVVVLPLVLFAVPSVAAGDATPARALPGSVMLAVRNYTRTWGVWLITLVFSAPVAVSMFLAVSAFAGGVVASLLALVLSVPVVWPFSALFVRALYGDLTGRAVVAAQDRTR
jgi:hypothetical protein